MQKLAAVTVLAIFFLSSCVTSTLVRFDTPEQGADVTVDGQPIGKTPTQIKMSNAVWEDPDIVVKQEGYRDNYYDLEKELKAVNFVCGLLIWWPSLLWVWGPDDYQFVQMIEE